MSPTLDLLSTIYCNCNRLHPLTNQVQRISKSSSFSVVLLFFCGLEICQLSKLKFIMWRFFNLLICFSKNLSQARKAALCCTSECAVCTKSRPCTKFVIRPNYHVWTERTGNSELHFYHTISSLLTVPPLELTRLCTQHTKHFSRPRGKLKQQNYNISFERVQYPLAI